MVLCQLFLARSALYQIEKKTFKFPDALLAKLGAVTSNLEQIYQLFQFGNFGYNCMMGMCDFIVVPGKNKILQKYPVLLAFGVPFIVTFVSYAIIWIKVKRNK